jgi:hypothetical protein
MPAVRILEDYPGRKPYTDIPCPDCVGECSKDVLRECDWYYELENGIILDKTGVMCD